MVQPSSRETARRFRQTFGLDDSDEAMDYAATFDQISNGHGVPLNPEELADLDERSRQQDEQGPFAEVAASLSEVLGGVWKDQRRRGEYVIMALPSLSATELGRLIAALPSGARYRVESATVSEATMRAWVIRLTRSLMLKTDRNDLTERIEQLGLEVSTIQPDVPVNRLVVYLTRSPSQPDLDDAWDYAVEEGEAPPRTYTTFDVRPKAQPRTISSGT
ncbi:MAG TPA: hypothetical protein VFZ97_08360 [Acidimicrobiales bacterium]